MSFRKECKGCHRKLSLASFYRRLDGYQPKCKQCENSRDAYASRLERKYSIKNVVVVIPATAQLRASTVTLTVKDALNLIQQIRDAIHRGSSGTVYDSKKWQEAVVNAASGARRRRAK